MLYIYIHMLYIYIHINIPYHTIPNPQNWLFSDFMRSLLTFVLIPHSALIVIAHPWSTEKHQGSTLRG